MTLETLRQMPVGTLEKRSFTMESNCSKHEEFYFLVKCRANKYFIGFSEDGMYSSSIVSEEHMLKLINDEELSSGEAIDIYLSSPQLSCWID